jgi:hypothetical protein
MKNVELRVRYGVTVINMVIENYFQAKARTLKQANKLRDLSPRANYTDRAIAVCWRS